MAYVQKNNPFKQKTDNNNGGKKNQFDYSKKVDYSNSTATSKAIVDFLTPQNTLELGLEALPGGVGVGKLGTKLLKSKYGKKLISKFPSLEKLTKPISTSTKNTKRKGFDFNKKTNFTGKKDIHMGSGPEVVNRQLNEMKSIGQNLDEMNFDASKLTAKDVKFRGIVSGRSVVEVNTPSGPQLFYKSTDYSGKGVEDMWQSYGGHADVAGRKGWFIKDEGFKNFYDSRSFRDIAGNLDRIAVEGDFQKHIKKGQGYASKINK